MTRVERSKLHDFVARIKYKPNWTFVVSRLREIPYHKVWCSVVVPDITPPHREIAISNFLTLPNEVADSGNEELYKMKIEELILATEKHEMHEWLTLDGKHITAPHPEPKGK